MPILGSVACQRLKFITVNMDRILQLEDTTMCVKDQQAVFNQFKDVFEGVGKLEGQLHLELDPTITPVRMPLRKLPVPIKDKVKLELESMIEQGIIEPVKDPSDWISAVLVVAKANGKLRICIDPKPL